MVIDLIKGVYSFSIKDENIIFKVRTAFGKVKIRNVLVGHTDS